MISYVGKSNQTIKPHMFTGILSEFGLKIFEKHTPAELLYVYVNQNVGKKFQFCRFLHVPMS